MHLQNIQKLMCLLVVEAGDIQRTLMYMSTSQHIHVDAVVLRDRTNILHQVITESPIFKKSTLGCHKKGSASCLLDKMRSFCSYYKKDLAKGRNRCIMTATRYKQL